MASVVAQIAQSKAQLDDALGQRNLDDAYITGIHSFVRGRFVGAIIRDINSTYNGQLGIQVDPHVGLRDQAADEDAIALAQHPPQHAEQPVADEQRAEALIDKMWSDFHYPILKYYKQLFDDLKKDESRGKKRLVELRKLISSYKKLGTQMRDFYNNLLKQVLTQFKLQPYIIPKPFYDFLQLEQDDSNGLVINKNNQQLVVKLVYIVHRSILFIGVLSRYRSQFSHYLPKSDHKGYSTSLKYCYYSELLLPAFGDARNYIGMVYNLENDLLSASYEFLRSGFARIPSNLGLSNFDTLMRKSSTQIFEKLNELRLKEDINNKSRIEYISYYFLTILGYYYEPELYRQNRDRLKNGTVFNSLKLELFNLYENFIENNEREVLPLLEKQIILLIGVFQIKNDTNTSLGKIDKNCLKLLEFLVDFVINLENLLIENFTNVKFLAVLPSLRIVFSWLKITKISLQFVHRHVLFNKTNAKLLNLIFEHYPNFDYNHRPKRDQYFDEDVNIREFTPLNRMLWDFDDSEIFNKVDSSLNLIGKFKSHNIEEENSLRIQSIGYLGKKIVYTNSVGMKFEDGRFDITTIVEKVKPKKVKPDVVKPVATPPAKQTKGKDCKDTLLKTPSPKVKENKDKRKKKNNNNANTKKKEGKEEFTANRVIAVPDASQLPKSHAMFSDSVEDNSVNSNSSDIEEISSSTFKGEQKPPSPKPPMPLKLAQHPRGAQHHHDTHLASMVDSLVDDFSHSPLRFKNMPPHQQQQQPQKPHQQQHTPNAQFISQTYTPPQVPPQYYQQPGPLPHGQPPLPPNVWNAAPMPQGTFSPLPRFQPFQQFSPMPPVPQLNGFNYGFPVPPPQLPPQQYAQPQQQKQQQQQQQPASTASSQGSSVSQYQKLYSSNFGS